MARKRRDVCKTCGVHLDDELYKRTAASGYCLPHYKEWFNHWSKTRYAKGSLAQRAYYFGRNNAGSKLTEAILEEIFSLQNRSCKTCGDDLSSVRWEIDHILPVSRGGTHDKSNLQILCKRCNRAKDNGSMSDFVDWVRRISERINAT